MRQIHASALANEDYLRKKRTPLNTAFNLIQPMEENQFRCFANLPKAPETIALAEYNEEWERKNDQAGEDLPG